MADLYSCITGSGEADKATGEWRGRQDHERVEHCIVLYSCILLSRDYLPLVILHHGHKMSLVLFASCYLASRTQDVTNILINCVVLSVHTCSIFTFSFSPFLQVIIKRHSSQTCSSHHSHTYKIHSLHSLNSL